MEMSLIVSGVVLILVGVVLFLGYRQRRRGDPLGSFLLLQQQLDSLREQMRAALDGNVHVINQQLAEVTRQLSERLQGNTTMVGEANRLMQEANKAVGERLDNASRVVSDVSNRLGRVEEATQKVFDVGKDIASLQEILRAPKLRGILGELFLGDLLAQILPPEHYSLQFTFKGGQTVDAVIRLGGFLVPVDSKFPLENFRRMAAGATDEERRQARRQFVADVKRHIDAIAEKYICPQEGTSEFALMYVPAENVYYEIITKDDDGDRGLQTYAHGQKVIPVSPNNFYAYLQTILFGLKGMKLEQRARQVQGEIAGIRGELNKFGDDFEKIGKHLSNAHSAFTAADKRLGRLADHMESLNLPSGPVALVPAEADANGPRSLSG